MKKIFRIFFLFIIVSVTMVSLDYVQAYASEKKTSYQIYIDDAADLLTEEEEKELASKMSTLLDYGNMMFTTVKLKDSDYESHAEQAYYDRFGHEPGIHFQIDMGNRKLTLNASTDMEEKIGSERDSIVDNIYTYATDGDYEKCAEECFQQVDNVLHNVEISHKMKHINNAIVAVILGLLLNLLLVFASCRVKNNKRKKLVKANVHFDSVKINKGPLTKIYYPVTSSVSSSSDGSSSSGGGGGGFDGGSSSHGF